MSLTILSSAKESMVIDGRSAKGVYADLWAALRSVSVKETITGASTCTLVVEDPKKIITRSGLVAARVTIQIDGAGYELANGRRDETNGLTLDFEDMAVASLKRRTGYLKVAAGQMSRAQFAQRLIHEESWIKVNAAPGALSKVELARGSADSTATGEEATGTTGGFGSYGLDPQAGTKVALAASIAKAKKATTKDRKIAAGVEKPENSWDAVSRIMGEIGWRTWALRKAVTIAPDSWILTHGTTYTISDTTPGVELITWEYDPGQPAATAALKVRCGTTTTLTPGSKVVLSGEGPADGSWLVETIQRTDRDDLAEVDLIQPQPALPEPTGLTASDMNLGEGGFGTGFALDGAAFGTPSTSAVAERFVQAALAQSGKPYVWGASGPSSFDCSGLVQYCAALVGGTGSPTSSRRVSFSKPVGSQLAACTRAGTLLTVQQAIATRGALLIRGPNEHIAISLGNGKTIEARGKAYGVGSFDAVGRNWTTGAYVPGIGVAVTTGRTSRGD